MQRPNSFPVRAFVLACALSVIATVPARAAELFGGVFAHDINLGITACCYERGADVVFGGRTDPFAYLFGSAELRAHAFGSANTLGGVDFAALGLDLRFPIAGGRLYLQPGLGGAVQDGSDAKYQVTPNRLYLGSRMLFEPEMALGWRLSPRWATELAYVHLSHAQLAGPQNPGLDELGLRVVYRLGR